MYMYTCDSTILDNLLTFIFRMLSLCQKIIISSTERYIHCIKNVIQYNTCIHVHVHVHMYMYMYTCTCRCIMYGYIYNT